MANTASPSIPNESVPDRSRSEEEPLLGSPDGLADDQKNVLWPNLIMGTTERAYEYSFRSKV